MAVAGIRAPVASTLAPLAWRTMLNGNSIVVSASVSSSDRATCSVLLSADLDLAGTDLGQKPLQRRPCKCGAGIAAVVVVGGQRPPAFMPPALDIGLASVALGVERVEVLLQSFLRGLPGIDCAPADRRGCG